MIRRGWAWAAVVTGLLVRAHVAVIGSEERIAGPLLVLDHLFAVALAVALLLFLAAAGERALAYLDLSIESAIERFGFSVVLGLGAVSTALLLIGAVVGVGAPVLALCFGGGALFLRNELAAASPRAADAVREWARLAGGAGTAALVLAGACLLVLALAPPTDTDSLNYHLRVPLQFLERGRFYLPEDNLQAAWVGLAHLPYLPLLALRAPAAPALLNALLALVLAAVVTAESARIGSRAARILASVLVFGSPILLLVAATPKVDVTLALFLFLGHVALLRAFERDERRGWLIAGGLALGFGVGIKLLALPWIAALTPLLIWMVATRRPRSDGLRQLALFGVVTIAAALPWLLKNWILIGAPFYPEFAPELLPPWLDAIYQQQGIASGSIPHGAPLREVREPFSLYRWFVAPERLTPESDGRAFAANPAFVLVLLALPLIRDRAFVALAGPTILFGTIALVLGNRINLRYLIPAIPGLTLIVAWGAGRLLDRVQQTWVRNSLLAVITIGGLIRTGQAIRRKLDDRPALALASGRISRGDYRLTARDVEIAPYARITSRVNALLGPEARVLLLFEPRGLGFEARVIQDHLMTNWLLLAPALSPPRCLESTGITHVFVGTGTLGYLVDRGLDPRSVAWDRFDDFAARCLDVVEQHDDFSLYRARPAAPSGAAATPRPPAADGSPTPGQPPGR